jgi:hypothetical protein
MRVQIAVQTGAHTGAQIAEKQSANSSAKWTANKRVFLPLNKNRKEKNTSSLIQKWSKCTFQTTFEMRQYTTKDVNYE